MQSSAAQPAPSNQHCTVNCAKLCCEVHCTFVQCIKNLHSAVSKHLSFPMLHTSFCTCALHTILILQLHLYCIILHLSIAILSGTAPGHNLQIMQNPAAVCLLLAQPKEQKMHSFISRIKTIFSGNGTFNFGDRRHASKWKGRDVRTEGCAWGSAQELCLGLLMRLCASTLPCLLACLAAYACLEEGLTTGLWPGHCAGIRLWWWS